MIILELYPGAGQDLRGGVPGDTRRVGRLLRRAHVAVPAPLAAGGQATETIPKWVDYFLDAHFVQTFLLYICYLFIYSCFKHS